MYFPADIIGFAGAVTPSSITEIPVSIPLFPQVLYIPKPYFTKDVSTIELWATATAAKFPASLADANFPYSFEP